MILQVQALKIRAGYNIGMWIFSTLGFLGLIFAFLLRKSETGPNAHGLEDGMKK